MRRCSTIQFGKKSVWLGSRWLSSVTPNFLLVFMFCSHSFLFDVLSQFLFAAINLLFVELIWSSPYSSEEDHVNLLWAKFGPLLFFTPIHQLCNKKMFTFCLKHQSVFSQQSIIFVLFFENEQHPVYPLTRNKDQQTMLFSVVQSTLFELKFIIII